MCCNRAERHGEKMRKLMLFLMFIISFAFSALSVNVLASNDLEHRVKRLPYNWYTPREAEEEVTTINIRPLLRRYTNDVWHLFGYEIDSYDEGLRWRYRFDTGVSIGLEDNAANNVPILSIGVGFYGVDYRFHFDGINMMTTYEEIVDKFGLQGGRREEHGNRGAEFSYVYTRTEYGWAGFSDGWVPEGLRFYFDDDYVLVGISWFQPV